MQHVHDAQVHDVVGKLLPQKSPGGFQSSDSKGEFRIIPRPFPDYI